MSERLTKWEGHNVDGTPRAVIAKRDGLFPDLLQPILKKLAEYEDEEERKESHKTNRDRLEAMTDEQLAAWLTVRNRNYVTGEGFWLEWLRQEAKK